MNDQMVKLWIKNEIRKIRRYMDNDQESVETGEAKIDVLEKFYEEFGLDRVSTKVTYHDQI